MQEINNGINRQGNHYLLQQTVMTVNICGRRVISKGCNMARNADDITYVNTYIFDATSVDYIK